VVVAPVEPGDELLPVLISVAIGVIVGVVVGPRVQPGPARQRLRDGGLDEHAGAFQDAAAPPGGRKPARARRRFLPGTEAHPPRAVLSRHEQGTARRPQRDSVVREDRPPEPGGEPLPQLNGGGDQRMAGHQLDVAGSGRQNRKHRCPFVTGVLSTGAEHHHDMRRIRRQRGRQRLQGGQIRILPVHNQRISDLDALQGAWHNDLLSTATAEKVCGSDDITNGNDD
jgi:hypothetical protein